MAAATQHRHVVPKCGLAGYPHYSVGDGDRLLRPGATTYRKTEDARVSTYVCDHFAGVRLPGRGARPGGPVFHAGWRARARRAGHRVIALGSSLPPMTIVHIERQPCDTVPS